jgi:hypothetical protein
MRVVGAAIGRGTGGVTVNLNAALMSLLKFSLTNFDPTKVVSRVGMMARPNGHTATTDRIDWREARYFARIVQMLVSSRPDKSEFKQDLEHLVSAAAALRDPASRATGPDRTGHSDAAGADPCHLADDEVENAVLALWRRNPSGVRQETAPHRDEATAVETPGVSRGDTGSFDAAELACAVEEIERAAAALRAEESGFVAAGDSAGRARRRPLRFWLQIAGLWISIAAATAGMVVGLLVVTR